MGKLKRKDSVVLDNRALRKKAEHQRRVLEENLDREADLSTHQRHNQEPKRERLKSRRPKEARTEEVCCTITTAPASPIVGKLQKLEQATAYIPEEKKNKLVEELKSLETSKAVQKMEQPIVVVNPKIQPMQMWNRKRWNDFLRKRKPYKRLEPVESEPIALDMDVELQRLLGELAATNSNGIQENLKELRDHVAKETQKMLKKKSDLKTEFRRHHDNHASVERDSQKNQWLRKVIQQAKINTVYPQIGFDLSEGKEAFRIMSRFIVLKRGLLDQLIDTQVKTNKCSDGYMRLLNRYTTQESVVDSFRHRVIKKSSYGRNVLKNQIKLLDCAYSHLFTKGLESFTKKPSTSLKEWRQIVLSYKAKHENTHHTFERLYRDIQDNTSKLETERDELRNENEKCSTSLESLADEQQKYEARVLQSHEYKMVSRQREALKDEIVDQKERLKEEKIDLETILKRVREAGTKPPNYDELTTVWRRTRDEIVEDAQRTAKLREETIWNEEQIQSKTGDVLKLQIRHDELERELNTILEDKAFVNREYNIAQYQRKKLNLKFQQIQSAN